MFDTVDLPSYYPGYDEYCYRDVEKIIDSLDEEVGKLKEELLHYKTAIDDIDYILSDNQSLEEIQNTINELRKKY